MRYAALGSSYAAGPGIEPMADRRAMRSERNYPHVLAGLLGAELTDLTISGATTATIVDTPQRLGRVGFPPQLDGLPAEAELVTVTAGGNDVGYLGTAMGLALLGRALPGPVEELASAWILRRPVPSSDAVGEGLVRVVDAVRERAPGARVVLVDYLPVVGPGTVPGRDLSVTPAGLRRIAELGDVVAGGFEDAARRTGADLVRASEVGRGHEMGTPEPYLMPVSLRRPVPSLHPTAEAMAAVAAEIHRHLTSG